MSRLPTKSRFQSSAKIISVDFEISHRKISSKFRIFSCSLANFHLFTKPRLAKSFTFQIHGECQGKTTSNLSFGRTNFQFHRRFVFELSSTVICQQSSVPTTRLPRKKFTIIPSTSHIILIRITTWKKIWIASDVDLSLHRSKEISRIPTKNALKKCLKIFSEKKNNKIFFIFFLSLNK